MSLTKVSGSMIGDLVTALQLSNAPNQTFIVSSSITVNTNTTIPEDVSIVVMSPGKFVIENGVTLTINGALQAGPYQIFECASTSYTAISFGSQSTDFVYPEWWGAVADGTTDTTIPMNHAINHGINVRLMPGIYSGNPIHTNGMLQIIGAGGGRKSGFKSHTSTGYAFTEANTTGDWGTHVKFEMVEFQGDELNRNGFSYGDPNNITPNIALAGKCHFQDCTFSGCKVGFIKRWGNLGNYFLRCAWRDAQDYCYYADGIVTPIIMHPGCDQFQSCEMNSASRAAIYINDPTSGGGQTIINDCILEANPGFAIFVNAYSGNGALTINNIWLEGNASLPSVIINSISYTPKDIYIKDCYHAIMNGGIAGKFFYEDSSVTENGMRYALIPNIPTTDATATRIINGAQILFSAWARGGIVNSIDATWQNPNEAGLIWQVPHRSSIVGGYTPVSYRESFSGAGPWTFYGTPNVNATSVSDGVLYSTCAQITAPANWWGLPSSGGTFGVDEWYVYSYDVKLMTNGFDLSKLEFGTYVPLFYPAATYLKYNEWVTIGGIKQATDNASFTAPSIRNFSLTDSVTLRFSSFQVVKCASEQAALDFFNSRLFYGL